MHTINPHQKLKASCPSAPENNGEKAFGIYIVEVPGQIIGNLVKVGSVLTGEPEAFAKRNEGLRSAANLFACVPLRAFAVKPIKCGGRVKTERMLGWELEAKGMTKCGELFFAPGRSAMDVAGAIEAALVRMNRIYWEIDVAKIAHECREKNRDTIARIQQRMPTPETCPYEDFLARYDTPRVGFEDGVLETRARLHELATLGYLAADLLCGLGIKSFHFSPSCTSDVTVYPHQALAQAHFEARCEQNLIIPAMGRIEVRAEDPACLGERPLAMLVGYEGTLLKEVPGAFEPISCVGSKLSRFRAEHLAALGDRAVITEVGPHYFAAHARAPLPPKVYALAKDHPEWLPSLRYWIGLITAWKRNTRIQDYTCPSLPPRALRHLPVTAKALQRLGFSLSKDQVILGQAMWR